MRSKRNLFQHRNQKRPPPKKSSHSSENFQDFPATINYASTACLAPSFSRFQITKFQIKRRNSVLSTLHRKVGTHQLRENCTDESPARQTRKSRHRKGAPVRRVLALRACFETNTSTKRERVDSRRTDPLARASCLYFLSQPKKSMPDTTGATRGFARAPEKFLSGSRASVRSRALGHHGVLVYFRYLLIHETCF